MRLKKVLMFLILIPLFLNLRAEDLVIARDGVPNAEIILIASPDETESFAKDELQCHLRMITGAEIPAAHFDTKTHPVKIFLGKRRGIWNFPKDVKALKGSNGFAIRRRENAVYIFGATSKGTLNGVYDFLKRNSDIIWDRGDHETGTRFTPTPTFKVAIDNYLVKPAFTDKGWLVCSTFDNGTEKWIIRNQCDLLDCSGGVTATKKKRYGVRRACGAGHGLDRLVPAKTYFETHPEYYAEIDGERVPTNGQKTTKGGQLCFTNEDIADIAAATILKWIDEHPDVKVIKAGIQDNWKTCDCPKCLEPISLPDGTRLTKEDPAFRSTQFFMFLNRVANKVSAKHKDITISTFGYYFTAIPPKIKIDPDIEVFVCPYPRNYKESLLGPSNKKWADYLREWATVCGNLAIREYYGFNSFFPRPLAEVVQKDLLFYNQLGIRKIRSETIPDLNVLLERSWPRKETVCPKHAWDVSAVEFWVITQLWWDPSRDIDQLRNEYITRTFKKAAEPIKQFYGIINKEWYKSKAKSRTAYNPVTATREYILSTGQEHACLMALNQALAKADDPKTRKLVSYLNDAFKNLIKEAHKKNTVTMSVPRLSSPIALTQKSPKWEQAALVKKMKEMGTKPPPTVGTKVKVFHDNNDLYFLFNCDEPKIQKAFAREPTSTEEWTPGDHCEIFLASDSQNGEYYHFCVDFKGNKYDAKEKDKSWDSGWETQTAISSDGYQIAARIPLKSIFPKLEKGKIKALLYRKRQCDLPMEKREYISWNGGAPHTPVDFGVLILDKWQAVDTARKKDSPH